MPFATCRRCNAVFIISVEDDVSTRDRCPYCGQVMDRISREEAQNHIREQWQDEGADREPGEPQARGMRSLLEIGLGKLRA